METRNTLIDKAIGGYYVISYDNAKVTAKIFEDFNFKSEPIYLVEMIVYSVRGKVALQEFKEFPRTKKGRIRAERLVKRVLL